jgi:hypothetical protein
MRLDFALPFSVNYPQGFKPSQESALAFGTTAPSTPAGDTIDIRVPLPGGSFTAEAGDMLSLRHLYSAGGQAYSDSMRYRVALRDNPAGPGGGRLMLDDQDVTDRIEFSAMEFARLQFIAGADGAETDLVVARSGTPDGAGGLRNFVDSQAVQVTAQVTGTRSINAAAALRTAAGADEAAFLQVVKDSALHAPIGGRARPGLTGVGQPDAPPMSIQELTALTGAFQSAGAAPAATTDSGIYNLRRLYSGTLGGSVTANWNQSTNQNLTALLMLLGVSDVGGRETTGNTLQHLFASQAYLRSQ